MKNLLTLLIGIAFSVSPLLLLAQQPDTISVKPQPRVIPLNLLSSDYQEIFHGAPETVSMHSGLVTLKTGQSVGTHNSEEYEEIIVFLEGEGEMIITNGETLKVGHGMIAYCPPHTEHNLIAIGSTPLKYIYIAAKTTH
ncbi:MAG: cupin domain-containing protein [Bacteroidales bacterium]|nr:cupin domain-containing protein [Deltaproteobacteria bacterium]MBL7137473.1 cupin domain-containing protein [Bacteroidales bacterium]